MKAVVQVLKYLFSDDTSAHEVLHDFGHNGRVVLHWIEFLKQNKYIEENSLGEFVPTYKELCLSNITNMLIMKITIMMLLLI